LTTKTVAPPFLNVHTRNFSCTDNNAFDFTVDNPINATHGRSGLIIIFDWLDLYA
jgi:hypothetical protein